MVDRVTFSDGGLRLISGFPNVSLIFLQKLLVFQPRKTNLSIKISKKENGLDQNLRYSYPINFPSLANSPIPNYLQKAKLL
jgi:hypothetical protein